MGKINKILVNNQTRSEEIALPSEIDREHLDESGHAALADAIYKTITESGLLEKGMDSSFCHIA